MSLSLEGIGLVLAPTFRSRAYVQTLAARNLTPALVLHLPGVEEIWKGRDNLDIDLSGPGNRFRYSPGEPARETTRKMGWTEVELPHGDINNSLVVEKIRSVSVDVLVYSGKSRALLDHPILATGKSFLHVHGGYLPDYRAATGFYFGLLDTGKLGESAIWLDSGVDTGPLIARRWYDPNPEYEMDHIFEPLARADLLADVLLERCVTGRFAELEDNRQGESYFVIHPVLKHLALRRAGLIELNGD